MNWDATTECAEDTERWAQRREQFPAFSAFSPAFSAIPAFSTAKIADNNSAYQTAGVRSRQFRRFPNEWDLNPAHQVF
jgi:hypothetical protein